MPSETAKKIQEAVWQDKKGFLKNPEVRKLQEYYEKMKKLGLAKKQEYTLPRLDTVGVSCYSKQS